MPLATYDLIRSIGNLGDSAKTPDTKLTPFLNRASAEVEALIPDDYETYEEELEGEEPSNDAVNCQYAEAYLTLSKAVIPLSIRASQDGGFVQSVATGAGQNTIISFDDAKKLQEEYKSEYQSLIREYIDVDISEEEDTDDDDVYIGDDFDAYAI
jgi:hypothetical protein